MSGVEIVKLVKIAYNSTPSKNTPCTLSRTSSSPQSEIDLSLSSFTFLFSG